MKNSRVRVLGCPCYRCCSGQIQRALDNLFSFVNCPMATMNCPEGAFLQKFLKRELHLTRPFFAK